MTDVLSADAIAQLFAAAEEGNLPEGPRAPERRARSIRKINFGRPMMLSLAEQRRFERAHTNYCLDAASRLSNELLTTVELEVINSSQLAWGGAVSDLPQPSVLGVAACTPGEAKVLICVEESLVLRMIERLLGGSFTETQPSRRLTEIDLMLARAIFAGLLAPLSTVWRGLLGLKLHLVDFESREKSLELLPSSESTLELTFEARDESASSTISLLVPHAAIKSATKSLGITKPDSDEGDSVEEAEAMRSALGSVHLEVRAEAGEAGLTLAQVLSLSEGDVVRLGTAGSACITVGDSPLHRVRPGLSGKRRAVQIIDRAAGER
jgi:flagellar motor switch protein FliM